MTRQRLGQHFLEDPDWREQILRAIGISAHSMGGPRPVAKNSCWIEIGAGRGEMTEYLAATGSAVYAVELDKLLIARLQRLAKTYPNLTIIPADILETDIAAMASARRIRVYGNLPYYITSPILRHLFDFAAIIDEIHIVVQLEVAQRLVAQPGIRDYGYLSVFTQYFSRAELVLEIPKDAFTPPPEVDSALVSLTLPSANFALGIEDEERFLDFVKLCFSQKRKTLVNNLRSLAGPVPLREALDSIAIRPDTRAEQLSVAQFAALYRRLTSANI